MFGRYRKDFFSKFLDLKNGTPSKDTIRRFFKVLDPNVFEEHFIDWVRSLEKVMEEEYIGIDGKTIRQASRMSGSSLIHIVSAWAGKNEMVLGQVKTDEIQEETRYYISSKFSAEENCQAIRHHWGIENKLHWSLDMTY